MKKEKNRYYEIRKKLDLTRDEACQRLDTITIDKLEKIENNRQRPNPMDVVIMADIYNEPSLRSYYCFHECPIGQKDHNEIQMKELSQIVLEIIDSMNDIEKDKDRLIDITVDQNITGDELRDFIKIKLELDKISSTVDALKLWIEKEENKNKIDKNEYKKIEEELKQLL